MSRFSCFSKCQRFYIILWNCGDHVQWFWQSLSDILQNEIIVLFLTPCFHGCSGMTRKLQPSSALVIFSSICHSQNNVREILKMLFCNKSVRENLKFMGHLQTSLKNGRKKDRIVGGSGVGICAVASLVMQVFVWWRANSTKWHWGDNAAIAFYILSIFAYSLGLTRNTEPQSPRDLCVGRDLKDQLVPTSLPWTVTKRHQASEGSWNCA